jgi:hypothetical protein
MLFRIPEELAAYTKQVFIQSTLIIYNYSIFRSAFNVNARHYIKFSPLSPPVSEPLTYRGVLLSTLLQAILNTFPPFAECIITDCK